jgi:uncharacterized protein YecT (DUF1311 family)
MNVDKKLNVNYKKLRRALSSTQKDDLRKTQKEWIEWRNEKCEAAQEGSGCNNGLCAGVSHDECMVDLTSRRATELLNFSKLPRKAFAEKYRFKAEYK